MQEREYRQPENTKPRRYRDQTRHHKEGLSILAEALGTTSPVELGTLVKKITAETFAADKNTKWTAKWKDLKDQALARAVDFKHNGSEKILIGHSNLPNKHREMEERLYFVFLGNEKNEQYITGIPHKYIPQINKYCQSRGAITGYDNVSSYVAKTHIKK